MTTTITAQPAAAPDTCGTCGGVIHVDDPTAVPADAVIHYDCLKCDVCAGTQADDDLDMQENGGRWQTVEHRDIYEADITGTVCSDECATDWHEAREAADQDEMHEAGLSRRRF